MDITTDVDACVALVEAHSEFDPQQIIQVLMKYSGVAKRTPIERIADAVAEEVRDLIERAEADLRDWTTDPAARARAMLDAGREPGVFPRQALLDLSAVDGTDQALAARLRWWSDQHRALAERVGWLLAGTSPEDLARLDPLRDCDRIFHAVSRAFRVEAKLLDLLAMLRIAQSSTASLFFRSTREAEDNSIHRFHDTETLFANFFEWGADSKRGRAAIARINEIHGRYYIPHAGMKFVLLNGVFTWVEGTDRIGHRPLSEVERLGYFHAYVKLGRAMHIRELTDDYAEMYRWFLDFAEANADPHPLKRDTFETIAFNSIDSSDFPQLRELLVPAARVAMHDTYRRAVGYPEPTPAEREQVRGVFYTLGALAELLPPVAFVRSLQNNPARPRQSPRPDELGVSTRSPHLPSIRPDHVNGGFPEAQLPLSTDDDVRPMELPEIDWTEVSRHNTRDSLWVVIAGEVYDLTGWARHHPGGLEILLRWAGRDTGAS